MTSLKVFLDQVVEESPSPENQGLYSLIDTLDRIARDMSGIEPKKENFQIIYDKLLEITGEAPENDFIKHTVSKAFKYFDPEKKDNFYYLLALNYASFLYNPTKNNLTTRKEITPNMRSYLAGCRDAETISLCRDASVEVPLSDGSEAIRVINLERLPEFREMDLRMRIKKVYDFFNIGLNGDPGYQRSDLLAHKEDVDFYLLGLADGLMMAANARAFREPDKKLIRRAAASFYYLNGINNHGGFRHPYVEGKFYLRVNPDPANNR